MFFFFISKRRRQATSNKKEAGNIPQRHPANNRFLQEKRNFKRSEAERKASPGICRSQENSRMNCILILFRHLLSMAKIRLAQEKDAVSIADIIKKHYEEDYMGYVTFNENYVKEKMKRNNFYFVAEIDDNVIGCLRASVVDIDLAEIRNICVEERYRNQGIATQLLEAAMQLLKEKKMRKIVARTIAWNDKALKFFKSFGFEQEGLFKEHYRKGIDVI